MFDPYAIVDSGGTVISISLWDGVATWTPPVGCAAVNVSTVDPRPSIGWTYTGGVWAAPPPPPVPVPQSISRFQAMAELSIAGLLSAATAAATAAGGIPLLAWQNAQSFERESPTIASLAAALNLTPAQLDALFIAASQIEA